MRALALLLLLLPLHAAHAVEPVDVALVLVSDVSRSIDDSEFELQKKGFSAAFQDPRVLAAIHNGPTGAIAVAYVEFAGNFEVKTVMDWRIVRDAEGARAMTDFIAAQPRSFYGRTSISAGIDRAMELLKAAPVEATRRVIDVAGDGTNNAGREVTEARDDALKAGVIINGLAIINDHPVSYTYAHVAPSGGLAEWYRQNVTGGEGSFVLEMHDFPAFGEAMIHKLISEIAALPAPTAPKRSPT
jgi:hypothetical protein